MLKEPPVTISEDYRITVHEADLDLMMENSDYILCIYEEDVFENLFIYIVYIIYIV